MRAHHGSGLVLLGVIALGASAAGGSAAQGSVMIGEPQPVAQEGLHARADALTKELIPYLEEKFRLIPQPHARVLVGGSTGG